eukprot:SAG31_NODE_10675_length_1111_cov_1.465415_1_plen_202_part_00
MSSRRSHKLGAGYRTAAEAVQTSWLLFVRATAVCSVALALQACLQSSAGTGYVGPVEPTVGNRLLNATAAELRRWDADTACHGSYKVLSTDVMDQCTPFHIPAPASILVVQKNGTAYSSFHYQGVTDCMGVRRTFLQDLTVGACSGDLGGYSQMRVWVWNFTYHCSPGCECCPCTGFACKGTCPDCGRQVCNCPTSLIGGS